MRPASAIVLTLCVLVVAACGNDNVDTSTYTCGEFNKSLRTKDDTTSGNYINQLRKQAKLDQDEKTERREITFGIIVACRNKPAATKPADQAITTAKQIKAGKFKPPAKKKSTK